MLLHVVLCTTVLCAQAGPADRTARYLAAVATDSLPEAETLFTSVVYDGRDVEIPDSLTGAAYHKLGVVAYQRDDFETAKRRFADAVRVRRNVHGEVHNDIAHSLGNLGSMYQMLEQLDSAADVIGQANTIYEQLPGVDSLNWLRSLNTLGLIAFTLEQYQLGRSASYRAVKLLEALQNPDPYDAFITYYRAARIQLRLDLPEEALPFARRAVGLAPQTGADELLPDAYNLLGLVQRDLRQHPESFESFRAARRQLERTDPEGASLAYVYANLADYYSRGGTWEQFQSLDQLASDQFAANDLLDEYYALDYVPESLIGWKQYRRAIDWLNEAIRRLSGPTGDHLADAPDKVSVDIVPLTRLLALRADAYQRVQQNHRALADYRTLFKLQDQLRTRAADNSSRQYYSQNLRPYFDRAIGLHYQVYQQTQDETLLWDAFLLSERSRAYSLLANLRSAKSETHLVELSERIASLERRVQSANDLLRDTLELARLQLQRLRQSHSTLPPEDPARERLIDYLRRGNTTLVEYHLSEHTDLVFVLSPEGALSVHPLEVDPQHLVDWRRAIAAGSYRRKSLRTPEVQGELDREFQLLGTTLTEALLPASVRKVLADRPGERSHLRPRLCLVPDGPLHYLPFAALLLGTSELPLSYAELPYLATRCELQYAYSATHLLTMEQQPPLAYAQSLVAFAPSFTGKSGEQAGRRSAGDVLRTRRGLGALQHNEAEVTEVAAFFGEPLVYRGTAASKEQFLKVIGSSRVLHLSSHGMVDPERPELSFIAFAQTADSLQPDQLLYFNDLYTLPLNNELTVLSACETSLGKLAAGETTMSLASAFAAAGARSTLTTLWQVDDEATKLLTVAFYRALTEGQDRATALRTAQQQLIGSPDYAHPYYWSGMALHGQAGRILLAAERDESSIPWWGWLIVAGSILLVGGGFLRFLHLQRPEVQLR